jgi:hypothetical protein
MLSDIIYHSANSVRSTSCHYFTSQGYRRNAIPSRAGVRRTRMFQHVGDLLTCKTIISPITRRLKQGADFICPVGCVAFGARFKNAELPRSQIFRCWVQRKAIVGCCLLIKMRTGRLELPLKLENLIAFTNLLTSLTFSKYK